MASSSYPQSIAFVLKQEGGYSNHPSDPGGPTNYGITIADCRKYWKSDATAADVKALPLSVAKDIYRKRYWDVVHGDDLPAGLDICTFDSGVNSGVARSNLWLGYAIGSTYKDYLSLSMAAILVKDLPKAINAYCDKRLSFLHGLKTWSVFGKGWGRRVSELRALAISMALSASGKTKGEVIKSLTTEVAKAKEKQSTTVAKASGATGVPTTVSAWSWQWDFLHVGGVLAIAAIVFFFAWHILHGKNDIDALEAEIARLSNVAQG